MAAADRPVSKGDAFLLAMAVLSAITAVAAATERRWVSVALFCGLAINFVVLRLSFRRRRRR